MFSATLGYSLGRCAELSIIIYYDFGYRVNNHSLMSGANKDIMLTTVQHLFNEMI